MKYLLFLTPLLFSGCIGIGFVHQETIKTDDCSYIKNKEDFSKWNNVELIEEKNGISTYKRKTSDFDLKGVIPMIGIGIPLILPFGYNSEYYSFKDDICIDSYTENSTWDGAMCGMLNENGMMGCGFLK